MRKKQQSSKSLRFCVSILMVLAVLFGLSASAISTRVALAQAITPTGSFVTFLPLISTDQPVPVGPVGGTFTSFAIDPGQNDNIYAGHYGSGVYKTFDQGTTWYRKSLGLGNLTIQSLATHPTSSAIVYAGTYGGGIYRSTNAGESWQASNGGVLNNHIIYDIEIDPSNPQRIFVASRINGSLVGYLARSMDGGLNWTILLTGDSFQDPDYFYDVDIDPNNSSIIYLTAHEHGFYKSVDGGVSFSAINTGVTDLSARSFAIDNAYTGLVYGGVWHEDGVYRTWNGGVSWAWSGAGLPMGVKLTKVTLDPFGRQQKRVFSCTYGNGLYSSDDFATSWVSRGLTGQKMYDFVIADGNPQRWYAATENNGIFLSNSYGSNWNSIMADLRLTAITGLAQLPGEPEALAGAVFGQGVYKVRDGGISWEPMNQGITGLDVLSLAVADERLYALGRGWMDAWDGQSWQAVKLPEVSQDTLQATEEWVKGRVLLPDEALGNKSGNLAQPTSLFWQDGTMLLGTAGSGLWAIEGSEWEQLELENAIINKIVQSSDGNVRVFACGLSGDCTAYELNADGKNALQASEEEMVLSKSGLLRLPGEIKTANPGSLTITKSNFDKCLFAVGEQNKVWISSNCGEDWTAHSFEWTIQALAFDPLDANLLLVGTRESGAFRIQVP